MSVSITPATLHHLPTLQAISRETFYEAFAAHNTPADMAKHLDDNFNAHKLTAELTNPHTRFFIAWHGTEPIGYLKLNLGPAQTDLHDDTALELERIYVKAAWHGRQVAQQLYHIAEEVARTHSKTYIWLGVWEHNPRAIAFYTKLGYTAFSSHIFMLGHDKQTDILMKKILQPPS
jgi:ribosomal protein S18 acetylase RimI-like enzyme